MIIPLQRTFLLAIMLLLSCSSPTYPPVENGLDAGRQFADAIFKGNFERAGQLILPTEENKNLLRQQLEENYHLRNNATRMEMAQASLQIQQVENGSKDSTVLIHFTNVYDGKPAVIKVVRSNGGWLVDLAYMFAQR